MEQNHIEYLDEFEDGGRAGWRGLGWYFWDETEAYCYGPFQDRVLAEEALKKYIETL
jgi:hypothetical protein